MPASQTSLASRQLYTGSAVQDPASNWRLILAVLATVIAAIALSLHAVGDVARRAEDLAGAGQRITPGALVAALHGIDAMLFLLTAVGCWMLWRMERRSRAASSFLVTATPNQFLVLLGILLVWLGHCYLFPGVLLGGDTGTHIARFLEVRRAFEAGAFPEWTNYEYLGSPLLGFTGPLTYVVGGALDLLIRNPVVTAKTLLFTLHIAGGLLFYWFLLRLELSRVAALTAALGFAGCFAHLHLFLYRGVFPQAFTIAFLVVLFATAEGMMRSVRCSAVDWLLFAAATAGLIINHQPHALFAALYLGLFGIARLGLGQWRIGALPRVVTAGLAGVGMALCAVIPVIAEADWVMIVPDSALFRVHLPTLGRLLQLVEWRNTRTTWGIDYWAYLGIVTLLLAGLGIWAGVTHRLGEQRRRLVLAVLPCLLLEFFLFNPVVRDVMFLFLFVGILAACGMEQVARIERPAGRLVLLALTAVLLDLSSTAVQPVARTDKQFMIDAGSYLQQNAPNQRVAQMNVSGGDVSGDIGPDAGPISAFTTVQRVSGTHNMAASRVHNYAEVAVKLAEQDLRESGQLSARSSELLSILNATRVVCETSVANGCPETFSDATPEGVLGRVIHIAGASPVLFSRSVSLLMPSPQLDKPMIWPEDWTSHYQSPQTREIQAFLDRYLQTARIDFETHQAGTLPVRDMPPSAEAGPAGGAAWHPSLLDYRVALQTVQVAIQSDQPGFVQLSHPWFPGLAVSVNGQEVQPLQGSLNLIVLPIQAGRSDIELRPRTTPIRLVSDMVSLGFLGATLIGAGCLAFRRKPEGAAGAEGE